MFATLWQCDNLDGHSPKTHDASYDSYSQAAQPWEQVELDRCLDKGLELMGANTHRATAGVFGGCDLYCEVLVTIVGAGSLLWGCGHYCWVVGIIVVTNVVLWALLWTNVD